MPPKKKKSAKKRDDKDLQTEEKYNQAMGEVKAMKDCLALRHSMLIQAKTNSEVCHQQLEQIQKEFQTQKSDYKAVSADMTRQYKTMQSEMTGRIHLLETELAHFKLNLKETDKLLTKEREEKRILIRDKNNEIGALQQKINSLQGSYEAILHEALDNLMNLIDLANEQWKEQSRMIQAKNMKTLSQFGLNPLDL